MNIVFEEYSHEVVKGNNLTQHGINCSQGLTFNDDKDYRKNIINQREKQY